MTRRMVLAVALLVSLLHPHPATAAPAPPRGADARLTWLERLPQPRGVALLHRVRGEESRLGVPRNPAYRLVLVGPTSYGWLVAQERQAGTRLWIVRGPDAHEVLRVVWHETPDQFLVAAGGARFVRWSADGAGITVKEFALSGQRLATLSFPGETGQLLRYDGAGVRFAVGDRTCLWKPDADDLACVDGAAATLWPRADLAFMPVQDGTYGPTSLADPGTPAWTADFAPRAVSRGATYVAGVAHTATTASEDLQVRRVSDGELVAVEKLTHQVGDDVWWEDDTHLVFLSGVAGKGYVLVRCDVTAGGCERASHYVTEYAFSVPGTVRHS